MRVAVALLLVAGCTKATVAPVIDAGPPPDDCTLATPLKPGVPGSPGHLIPSEINPNGASELATLMRHMQDDMKAARPLVLDGGAPGPMWSRHRKMRCSWPTDPNDRNEKFEGFAQAYLAMIQKLDARDPSPAVAYDSVLAACHACHDVSCPGPLVVIDQLRIVPFDGGVERSPGECSHQ